MNSSPSISNQENKFPANAAARQGQRPRLSLVYYPDPLLRAVCQPVDRFDSALRDLIREMFSLMQVHGGIGLAGPQVAFEQRVLVCAIQGQQLCLTNAEIQAVGDPREFIEGCLSLPNIQISVTRPERIRVSGYDVRGRKTRIGATGLWARVIQHELDHLNGVLICDRGRPPTQPCGPCSLALPAELIEERKRQSRPNRQK